MYNLTMPDLLENKVKYNSIGLLLFLVNLKDPKNAKNAKNAKRRDKMAKEMTKRWKTKES